MTEEMVQPSRPKRHGSDAGFPALSGNRGAIWAATLVSSTISCPRCGHLATETMPTDACQYFYDCPGCGAVLSPKPGDCCVFCSYGDAPCPPMQESGHAAIEG